MVGLLILPGLAVVVVVVVATVATAVRATAVLGFEIEVVEGDGGSADDGQEDEAIGQDGSVHLHQAGGEVDEEKPGIGLGIVVDVVAEVVGVSDGR